MNAPAPPENHERDTGVNAGDWWWAMARRTSRKVNAAWLLEHTAAPLLIGSAGASAFILLWRSQGNPVNNLALASASILLLLVLAAIAFVLARRRFESAAQSLVRIEAALGLHNALSAANQGVSPWPAPNNQALSGKAGLNWQWRRLALPPAVATAAIICAVWLPIQSRGTSSTPLPRQPLAWSQLDAELDALMDAAIIEETYIRETRDRIEQLRQRDPGEWYSHNTMEATDSITQTHRTESNRLQDAMQRAENAVERMPHADPESRLRQFNEYQKALDDMAGGAMKPNDALREQLGEITPENLNQLTPEQLDELRRQLRDANDKLRDAGGEPEPGAEPDDDGLPMPGGGDPDEDGEHSPGVLGDEPADGFDAGEFTPLAAKDLSHAALGDLLEIQSGEHAPADTSPNAPVTGGDTRSSGHGGDRVWRDSLDPSEQRTLRRFFE